MMLDDRGADNAILLRHEICSRRNTFKGSAMRLVHDLKSIGARPIEPTLDKWI